VSVRLFIGNLPYAATEADLREHLSSVGAPTQIVLPTDRETGRPRGFAFVDYADRGVAEEAIRRFNQQPFKGRPLAVSEARPREERPAGPRPGGLQLAAPAELGRLRRPAARWRRRFHASSGRRQCLAGTSAQLRAGCAAKEQTEADTEGIRARTPRADQRASRWPALRCRRGLARARHRRRRDG
jgi:RNA recognition motif-containing protein